MNREPLLAPIGKERYTAKDFCTNTVPETTYISEGENVLQDIRVTVKAKIGVFNCYSHGNHLKLLEVIEGMEKYT